MPRYVSPAIQSILSIPDANHYAINNMSIIKANTNLRIDYNTSSLSFDPVGIASGLAQININTAGIAANLAQININTAGIAANLAQININTADIATNTADIVTNTAGIAANLAQININTAGIAANLTQININTAGIAANLTQININTAGIATNTADIVTNTAGVAANKINYVVLTAAGAIIPTASGADQKMIDGTNHSYYVLAFDDTTVEKSDWQFIMPNKYGGGNIDVTILWVATPTSGGVVFDVNFGHAGDSDSVDPALTNQSCAALTVDGTSRDINTSSCTLTTPFVAGDYAIVRIHRETGDGSDTMVGDAEIISVILQWV